jgi:Flp pilus assembly protein TadG
MVIFSTATARPFLQGSGPSANGLRQRRGAAAVEFAVVASVFFMLVLGVVEFGRAFMVVELLNEAARRGCRQAIIEGTTSAQIKAAATDFLSTVGINGETAGVIINDAPADTVEAQNMPAYTEMTVQVTVPVASVTWVPNGIFPTGNLTGQFTMRRE